MRQHIAPSVLFALSLFVCSCISGAPNECEIDESYCEEDNVNDARTYCGDDEVVLVRPDVCQTYPFGSEYAGSFYCGRHLVEAWCKK